jgi:hypothetical protein
MLLAGVVLVIASPSAAGSAAVRRSSYHFDKLIQQNRLHFMHSIAYNYAPPAINGTWRIYFILPHVHMEQFRKFSYSISYVFIQIEAVMLLFNRCTLDENRASFYSSVSCTFVF